MVKIQPKFKVGDTVFATKIDEEVSVIAVNVNEENINYTLSRQYVMPEIYLEKSRESASYKNSIDCLIEKNNICFNNIEQAENEIKRQEEILEKCSAKLNNKRESVKPRNIIDDWRVISYINDLYLEISQAKHYIKRGKARIKSLKNNLKTNNEKIKELKKEMLVLELSGIMK